MYTITLLNQKGGGGKSTLCQSLAVAAHLQGRSVAILDIDPQGSTYAWGKRRAAYAAEQPNMDPDPIVLSVTTANLRDEWQRLKDAGADYVFIDTPARLNAEAGDAAKFADLVLVPCKATIKDLERVVPSIKLANIEGAKPTCIILNAVRAQGTRADEAEQFIKSNKLSVCPTRVGNYVAFEDADGLGLTPQEMDPNGKAAQDILLVHKHTKNLVRRHAKNKEQKDGDKT
jgi:chromosome partitioning protein